MITHPTAKLNKKYQFLFTFYVIYGHQYQLPLIHNAPNTTISPVPINLDRLIKPAKLNRPGEDTIMSDLLTKYSAKLILLIKQCMIKSTVSVESNSSLVSEQIFRPPNHQI